MESLSSPPLPSSSPPSTESTFSANATDPLGAEPSTSRGSSSDPGACDDFTGDCIQRFCAFLLSLPELAPLAARVETNVPRFVILNVLRMMTAELTLNIMMGDPPQADVLVQTLAAEHCVNLTAISAGDQLRCAKWLELFASYFADQEIA